jgi:hypothetical protein
MSIDPLQLLKSLGSGVRLNSPGSAAQAPQDANAASFDQLLQNAQAGAVSSGLPIRVASQAGVSLSPSQLARLSDAADRAEAAGASRALVTIDGMVLTMDVPLRTITGQADLSSTKVLTGVDAVVTVANDAGTIPGQVSLPASVTSNASLLKILAAQQPGAGIPG